jgi:hypothetical protein
LAAVVYAAVAELQPKSNGLRINRSPSLFEPVN